MNQQPMIMIPGLQPEEMMMIGQLTNEMTQGQQQQFYAFYAGKRKDQQQMLLMAAIGFFGIAGLHRLTAGDVGMGIIYLLTLGFCGIGTIIDLINMKSFTNNYNQKQALETSQMIKMMNP